MQTLAVFRPVGREEREEILREYLINIKDQTEFWSENLSLSLSLTYSLSLSPLSLMRKRIGYEGVISVAEELKTNHTLKKLK